MQQGDRGPSGMGTSWLDLSLSDPAPHPVTSVERCTPTLKLAGGGLGVRGHKGITPWLSELFNDALSRRGEGAKRRRLRVYPHRLPLAPAALLSAPPS